MAKTKDYNKLYTANRKFRKIANRFVYSRRFFFFALILIQILIITLFLIKLKPYVEYFFGGSILFSFLFMVYLVNCQGKNEFKMAWMFPLILFPLFGISAYLVYKFNPGGKYTGKNLEKLKQETKKCITLPQDTNHLFEEYPNIKGLSNYLINCGQYYPYSKSPVKYFSCGEEFYPDFYEEIKKAQKYIFIEFFIIAVDQSWQTLLELLEQKVKEGVEVRVLYDGLGSTIMSNRYYENYLNSKGIQTRIFLPLKPFISTQINNRDHRKIVIIDGQVAFTGGLNITNEYFNLEHKRFSYWKDNGIKISGPAIKTLLSLFLQNWNLNNSKQDVFEQYLNIQIEEKKAKGVVIPYGDDAYNNVDIAEDVYISILNNAQKYVHITSPYIILDNNLQNAILYAVRRGIEVSIIVPQEADHLITSCIGKTYLRTLTKGGVKVYLYKKGFIHSKTFISDNETATVGTINLDYRSLYHHFECGVVLHQLPVIQEIESDFLQTLQDCSLMEIEDYKKIPKRYRLIGRLFRIFAPLM